MSGRSYLISSAAVAGCAVVGSIASDPHSTWYRRLDKPPFNPPNWVFPVAWTTLFVDVAVTQGHVLARLQGDDLREHLGSLRWNLILNAGWSAVFFRARNLPAATAWAALLALDSASLVRRTSKVDRAAGAVLAPYAAWTAFATVLSAELWRRNRRTHA